MTSNDQIRTETAQTIPERPEKFTRETVEPFSMKIYHLSESGKFPQYFASIRAIERYHGGPLHYRLAVNRNNGQSHNGMSYGPPVCDCFHVSDHDTRQAAIIALNSLYNGFNSRFSGNLYVMSNSFNGLL